MSEELDLGAFHDEKELDGYDFPKKGQYHLTIVGLDNSREKLDAMKVTFQVLAGNVPGQEQKEFTANFFDPKPTHKDGGKFATKLKAKLALAAGLITPAALGTRVSINWDDLVYKQLVLHVNEYERTQEGKTHKGAEIDGLHIYGVFDPAVASVPKNLEALQLGGYVAAAVDSKPTPTPAVNGNGHATNGNGAAKSPAAAAADASVDPFEGIG